MRTYVLRRLLLMAPVMLLVSIIAFGLIFILPGDPAMAILGPDQIENRALYHELRNELGLDRPLPIQYLDWLTRVARGDLGTSIRNQLPVSELIGDSLAPTAQLTVMALLLALVIAVPIGVISAARPGSPFDLVGTTLAISGVAVPDFWLGILLIFVLSLRLHLLPPTGYIPPTQNLGQSITMMLMPAFTLGTGISAVITRQIRSSMLEVLGQDYIVTARAKGVRESGVIVVHALRNALIPVVTVIGLQVGRLIGGVVVAETIFAIPGMGRLAVDSIFFRDFPVVQGVVLVMAVAVLVANFVTDLLYAVINPRIRYA